MLGKIKQGIRNLLKKKAYIELIVALLTIPFFLSIIIINFSDIKNKNKDSEAEQKPVIIEKNNSSPQNLPGSQNGPSPPPIQSPEACKDKIGPISISSPKEGATVSDNPVNFIIKYEDESYCRVVWSYRINNSLWSEYSSNAPTVYNLPQGSVKFELRIQSTVSNDQELLDRNFIYEGWQVSPSPTSLP